MKLLTQIVFLLSITLGSIYGAQDSDGTEFVTSFLYKNAPDPQNFELSLYFIPTTNATTSVTYQYWSIINSKLMNNTFNLKYKDSNKHVFLYNDVISDGHYGDGQPKNLTDPRIYITSTNPIKVISRLVNLVTKQGDMYLVPTTSFASKKFLFKLPEPVLGREQIVHLLALPNKDANVQVISTGPQGHNLFNQTVKLYGTFGGNQIILPITTIGTGPSIYVSSDQPIIVIGAVVCANLNAFNVNAPSSNNTCDYAAYFPQQIGTWDCSSSLNMPDQRVAVGDHTANVIVSPSDSTCGRAIPVSVFSNVNPSNGLQQTLTPKLVSRYQIVHSYISELAISSSNGYLSMTRVGTPRATKNATLNGIFMHYVPDVTQYYTGETQFVAVTAGDMLEVYVENLKSTDVLMLDGIPMIQGIINPRIINSFNNVFTVIEFNLPYSGVHTFSSTANYIGYVISRPDSVTNTGYGYITGFGKTKIISNNNSGNSPTQVPLMTTTKSSSSITLSIILIVMSLSSFVLSYF